MLETAGPNALRALAFGLASDDIVQSLFRFGIQSVSPAWRERDRTFEGSASYPTPALGILRNFVRSTLREAPGQSAWRSVHDQRGGAADVHGRDRGGIVVRVPIRALVVGHRGRDRPIRGGYGGGLRWYRPDALLVGPCVGN